MSARLLIDAICNLDLPPMRATHDEIRTLRADPDLRDWYESADSIWSANAIAESLLVTYRNIKFGGGSSLVGRPPRAWSADSRAWWRRCEEEVDQHFAYWAVTVFLAGIAVGVFA